MIAAAVRFLVLGLLLTGCYRGTASLEEAEAKQDAAWLGTRLQHPADGPAAAKLLVTLAARGAPEARAVLKNRLVTLPAGPTRDRLDAEVTARLSGLADELAGDGRPPFRAAAARLRTR
jgi:hypothetical protein